MDGCMMLNEILDGELLGDGSLCLRNDGHINAYFAYSSKYLWI